MPEFACGCVCVCVREKKRESMAKSYQESRENVEN